VLLYVLMHRHLKLLDTKLLLVTLAKVLLAGTAMGVIAWAGNNYLLSNWRTQAFVPKAASLTAIIAVAGLAYVLMAMALRLKEVNVMADAVKRRLRRKAD